MSETRLVFHSRSFPPISRASHLIFYTPATGLATLTRTGHWHDHANLLCWWLTEGLLLGIAELPILVRL